MLLFCAVAGIREEFSIESISPTRSRSASANQILAHLLVRYEKLGELNRTSGLALHLLSAQGELRPLEPDEIVDGEDSSASLYVIPRPPGLRTSTSSSPVSQSNSAPADSVSTVSNLQHTTQRQPQAEIQLESQDEGSLAERKKRALMFIGALVGLAVAFSMVKQSNTVLSPTPTFVTIVATTSSATPTPTRFWVRNHRVTQMWSGPDSRAVSFAMTSSQWCTFLVVGESQNNRWPVWNPYDRNYFWIDASDVGSTGKPEVTRMARPPNISCSNVEYAP